MYSNVYFSLSSILHEELVIILSFIISVDNKFTGTSINHSGVQQGMIKPVGADVVYSSVILPADGSGNARISFTIEKFSASTIQQTVTLHPYDSQLEFHSIVDWHERHKLLKVEFPLNLLARCASYEIQGGFVTRPTHRNNSFDAAQFEVCGHRYADMSESDYGVSLLNDSKYGYSCRGSTLCLSLLRAPKSPDPDCDMGRHTFKYALYAHQGGSVHAGRVTRAASAFNNPVLCMDVPPLGEDSWDEGILVLLRNGLVRVMGEVSGLVVDSVKLAEDGRGFVLRLMEVEGTRGRALITAAMILVGAHVVSMFEQPEERGGDTDSLQIVADHLLQIAYSPFQIISIYVPRHNL
jgi:alpha-mannosidase